MNQLQNQDKSIFEEIGIKLFKSYDSRNPYTIYNLKTKKYLYHQAFFNVYDYLVVNFPKELYKALGEFAQVQQRICNTKKEYYNMLLNNVLYKDTFKELVNIEKINIDRLSYIPIPEQVIERNNEKILNLYVSKNDYSEIKADKNAKFPLCYELMLNIFGGDKNVLKKFLELLSFKIKYPEILVQSHWVIQDDGGTGKTEILNHYILNNLFNVKVISQLDLESSFNAFMINNQFVWCEEIENFGNNKRLKHLTGAPVLSINEKNMPVFDCKNYNTFIICTNDPKSIDIDERDRRFNIVGGGQKLMPLAHETWEHTYFKSKKANEDFFYKFHKNLHTELKNMYSYLLSLDPKRSEVQHIIDNEMRNNLIDANKQSYKLFIDDLIALGFEEFVLNVIPNNANILNDLFLISKNGEKTDVWVKFNKLYYLYEEFHTKYLRQDSRFIVGKNGFFAKLCSYNKFKEMFDPVKHRFYNEEGQPTCVKLRKPIKKEEKVEIVKIDTTKNSTTK